MPDSFETLFVGVALAQDAPGGNAEPAAGTAETTPGTTAEQPAPAAEGPPWVEYVLYGVIGAFILFLFLRGLKSGKEKPAAGPEVPRPLEPEHKSAEQIEAEAQQVFQSPLVHREQGRTAVRMITEAPPPKKPAEKKPTEDKKPAADKKPPADTKPEKKPAGEKAPPAKPVAPPIEEAGRTLREGLARTHDGFVKKLGKLFGGAKTIDDELLGQLEEALFTADIGVRTSQKLVDVVHERMKKKDLEDPARVWAQLKGEITRILDVGAGPLDLDRARPFVIMVVGVNGAGKTTTIGKLAHKLTGAGRKVLLAAGDTFRAAAVEQLQVWGERAGVPVVKGKEKQDPASVIFEAVEKAHREGYDVVIADTAGRLQAKKELMDELGKVHRVMGKAVPGAPHEVWLVLDATNGQNAISQAKEFTAVVDVTGLVLTKLDGTAKGGVVIGISDEMKLPVRYIGIGEKVQDLREFEPAGFADALFAET